MENVIYIHAIILHLLPLFHGFTNNNVCCRLFFDGNTFKLIWMWPNFMVSLSSFKSYKLKSLD